MLLVHGEMIPKSAAGGRLRAERPDAFADHCHQVKKSDIISYIFVAYLKHISGRNLIKQGHIFDENQAYMKHVYLMHIYCISQTYVKCTSDIYYILVLSKAYLGQKLNRYISCVSLAYICHVFLFLYIALFQHVRSKLQA